MSSAKPTVPAGGQKITISGGKLQVPDHPIIPFIEGDGTGPDIWRARVRVLDAAVAKAYGGKRKIDWMEVYAGEKAFDKLQHLAARRDGRGLPRVPRRHQGPAHHADRRRHPLAERRAAPDARPLRLPAPGALVQGRALARQAPREGGHGDLPREHRGHLRRHRVRGRHRGREEVRSSSSRRTSRRQYEKIRFPDDDRHRHQAGLAGRHRAPGPRRDRVRDRQQAQERDDRPQGQHHEVHRRRVPELGLRARRDASSPTRPTPGTSGSARRRRRARPPRTPSRRPRSRRARSSSRTRSPTSRCSRC